MSSKTLRDSSGRFFKGDRPRSYRVVANNILIPEHHIGTGGTAAAIGIGKASQVIVERRFAAIERDLHEIKRVLYELPEAIRQKIGFKAK